MAREKCAYKTGHKWKKWLETPTHIILKCEWCNGKTWRPKP